MWWEELCAVEVAVIEPAVVQEETHQTSLPVLVPASIPVPATEPDSDMFKKLSQLRKEIAYANGLPPYMVFHDKALWQMVEAMPQNMAAFSKISGVGQAKLKKYGESFLAVINGVAA